MSKLLSKVGLPTFCIAILLLFIVGLAGGVLGDAFGGGFLKGPIAHIQLAAEPITGDLFLGFAITNTMVATWMAMALLIIIAFFATRKLSLVPSGLQNLVEAVMEGFLSLTEGIAGKQNARRFFPLVFTIFIFIVMANWLGILPGFGTIGTIETAEHLIEHEIHEAHEEGRDSDLSSIELQTFNGDSVALMPFGSSSISAEEYEHHGLDSADKAGILVPFFRSVNTDLNTPLAIALVAMFMVHTWGIRAIGIFNYSGKFFNFSRLRKGDPMGIIDVFVGLLELVSEFARIISFTFRLFGNIFAGEVLLVAMGFLIPLIGIMPFLGLELFVGFIQAFIFAMLTLVFAVMATTPHEGEDH